jgi:tetratricopeptide (TPR) repeat protein
MVLRRLGQDDAAERYLRETLALDPLDWFARYLRGDEMRCDTQTRLDVVHDLMRAGMVEEAAGLLRGHAAEPKDLPTVCYTLAWIEATLGYLESATKLREAARSAAPDRCFPHRLEEYVIISAVVSAEPGDPRAHYLLGCFLYDHKCHEPAIGHWEKSAALDPGYPIVWRNLGIGYFNARGNRTDARVAYDRARTLNADDGRLLFERDLLDKRNGAPLTERLARLDAKPELVRERDDLSVEYCDLLNSVGRHEDARAYLASRRFQPWEGGEGLARGQHVRTHLALGRAALKAGDARKARSLFETAMGSPENLGEAKHMLANQSEALYWFGSTCEACGDTSAARQAWEAAASFTGDFQERAVRTYSEMTYFSAKSLEKLGRRHESNELFANVAAYARELFHEEAKVYYFATSLPARLLFDDLQRRQETTALLIEGQAEVGLGHIARGAELLGEVLKRDPSRAAAIDFLASLEK